MGNFYLDETKSFWGQVWEGISRHTWEYTQQSLGYSWSGIRNCWAERVDYHEGATYVTAENTPWHQGVTLGGFINGDLWNEIPSGMSFDDYIENNDQIYAHEYGHTIQSKVFGVLYPIIGLLSLGSMILDDLNTGHDHNSFFTEVMANRFAQKIFTNYTWGTVKYPIRY